MEHTNEIPFTAEHQLVYDLRTEVNQLHAMLGRMFEKGLITDDMITQALNEKVASDDTDTLKVIWNSWGGNPHYNIQAVPQFSLILKTIRSYQ